MFRIGYINIVGHINFPIREWQAKGFPVTIPEFVTEIIEPGTTVLDVRKPDEWKNDGVVEGSVQLELSQLFKNPSKLDKSKTYVTHCKSGYRAKIAWSFLKAQGFKVKSFPFPYDTIFNSGLAKKTKL